MVSLSFVAFLLGASFVVACTIPNQTTLLNSDVLHFLAAERHRGRHVVVSGRTTAVYGERLNVLARCDLALTLGAPVPWQQIPCCY